jgi:hypothetical protein
LGRALRTLLAVPWRAAALFRQEAFVSFLATGSWTELNSSFPRQPARDQRARASFMLLTDTPPQLQDAARHMVIKQSSNVRFSVQKAIENYEAGMHIEPLQFAWISVQII